MSETKTYRIPQVVEEKDPTPVPVLPPAGVVLLMALLFGAAGRLTRGRRS